MLQYIIEREIIDEVICHGELPRIRYKVSIRLNIDSGGAIDTYQQVLVVYYGPDKLLAQDIESGLKGANYAPFETRR